MLYKCPWCDHQQKSTHMNTERVWISQARPTEEMYCDKCGHSGRLESEWRPVVTEPIIATPAIPKSTTLEGVENLAKAKTRFMVHVKVKGSTSNGTLVEADTLEDLEAAYGGTDNYYYRQCKLFSEAMGGGEINAAVETEKLIITIGLRASNITL